ncbi:MAG: SDR family NAD(P)-dependent oxidoreductase [Coriobacteriales bacterium]|jgi:NAD(P)-dependent dehydrogenase (short-subunit alcohol dehydrogenase family)|nr:SDR family NAD(P)-dependent oxidoreductase [Coriobacteriales bacterium]
MEDTFNNKTVIVTGSGQGIGRAIAMAFGEHGANVVTNNRKPGGTRFAQVGKERYDALNNADKERYDAIFNQIGGDAKSTADAINSFGGRAQPAFGDITEDGDARRIVDAAVSEFGSVDILVNVAGAFGGGALTSLTEDEYDRVTRIKVKGYFNMMKYAIPYMEEKHWGRVINCSSKSMMGDVVRMAHYCTANAAAVGLTQAAACEYFSSGITCNAFSPFARTRNSYEADILGGPGETIFDDMKFPTAESAPDPKMLTPFIMWLCTEQASNVTGTFFTLNGNKVGLHQFPIMTRSIFKQGGEPWTLDELSNTVPRSLLQGYENVLHYQ